MYRAVPSITGDEKLRASSFTLDAGSRFHSWLVNLSFVLVFKEDGIMTGLGAIHLVESHFATPSEVSNSQSGLSIGSCNVVHVFVEVVFESRGRDSGHDALYISYFVYGRLGIVEVCRREIGRNAGNFSNYLKPRRQNLLV